MLEQPSLFPDHDYTAFLDELKSRIRSAQVKAALAVNQELIVLYWQIGRDILAKLQHEKWGAKVIPQLAQDLAKAFPEMKGFSSRNLKYMRAFAEAYPNAAIVQRSVAQLPWRHNIALLEKLKVTEERLWYAKEAIENGWSRAILVMQIESSLFQRMGGAITNFDRALPQPQSDLAQSLLKDPYHLDFLSVSRQVQEQGLVTHIRNFLLELGMGFSFVGSQYPIEVDGKEYRLDLLFYHFRLHCFVVIDLKMGEFEPEFSGKMNFYVSAVDHLLRSPRDERTIGIILCRSKRKTTVEFALQDVQKPIGVSTYRLRSDLPEPLQHSLPTTEQLEWEIETAIQDIQPNTADEPEEP